MLRRMARGLRRMLAQARDEPLEAVLEAAVWKNYGRLRVRRDPFEGRVNGVPVRLHHRGTTDDVMAIWQCFYKQQYRIPKPLLMPPAHGDRIEDFYRRIAAAGKRPLILDCGANIGAGVAWFRARYPASHIVALEPAPANLAILRRNAGGSATEMLAGGIAAQDGTMALIDPFHSSLAYQTVAVPSPTDRVAAEVRVFSIGALMRAKPPEEFVPFLLKIDIEGAEAELFGTGQEDFRKFPVIILEPHDFMTPGRGVTAGFFRFHGDGGRDFLYGHENIFFDRFQRHG